jgi:hypothetical protein
LQHGAIVEMPGHMSNNSPEDFRERAFRFTCKLFDVCEDLARTPGPSRQIANQLFDAGSSIGALGKKDAREWLLQESDEFVAMLTVSVRRLQTEPEPEHLSTDKSQRSARS